MQIKGVHHQSIEALGQGAFRIIDQTKLPHELSFYTLETMEEAAGAIRDMRVRGAPLIGATAACGLYLAIRQSQDQDHIQSAYRDLLSTRPTAVNLKWALDRLLAHVLELSEGQRVSAAFSKAVDIIDEDIAINHAIGMHGLPLLRDAWQMAGGSRPLNILTHCNAGWLATVDWGTALAPIYMAHDEGIPVHVWVDETRPRIQGALTLWELSNHGVPCTLVADNAGGYLMRAGRVDMCIVGTDRTSASGDVCNKIGTYLKALAAKDCDIPFYVALPHPTIDWSVQDAFASIPIETRGEDEVLRVVGRTDSGSIEAVSPFPEGTKAANPGFDITPNYLVSALITDKGVCPACKEGLLSLFPQGVSKGFGAKLTT